MSDCGWGKKGTPAVTPRTRRRLVGLGLRRFCAWAGHFHVSSAKGAETAGIGGCGSESKSVNIAPELLYLFLMRAADLTLRLVLFAPEIGSAAVRSAYPKDWILESEMLRIQRMICMSTVPKPGY